MAGRRFCLPEAGAGPARVLTANPLPIICASPMAHAATRAQTPALPFRPRASAPLLHGLLRCPAKRRGRRIFWRFCRSQTHRPQAPPAAFPFGEAGQTYRTESEIGRNGKCPCSHRICGADSIRTGRALTIFRRSNASCGSFKKISGRGQLPEIRLYLRFFPFHLVTCATSQTPPGQPVARPLHAGY